MSADRFDEMACELHKALGLEGFESDKPKIAAALRRVAEEEREAASIVIRLDEQDSVRALAAEVQRLRGMIPDEREQDINAALIDAGREYMAKKWEQLAHETTIKELRAELENERGRLRTNEHALRHNKSKVSELACTIDELRAEHDRLLEAVAEAQRQADEAYEAMRYNRERMRVAEQERNAALNERDRLREAMRYIAEHVQPGVAVSKAIEALGEVKP